MIANNFGYARYGGAEGPRGKQFCVRKTREFGLDTKLRRIIDVCINNAMEI